jgi:uncharacterized protein YycO
MESSPDIKHLQKRLRPGDVVVMTALPAADDANPIVRAGAKAFSAVSDVIQGKYTHSGVYVGNGEVIDLRAETGVRKIHLNELTKNLSVAGLRPNVSREDRKRAVERAHVYLKHRDKIQYSIAGLVPAAVNGVAGFKERPIDHQNMICSSLVANLYDKHKLTDAARFATKPSDFVKSKNLKAVGKYDIPHPAFTPPVVPAAPVAPAPVAQPVPAPAPIPPAPAKLASHADAVNRVDKSVGPSHSVDHLLEQMRPGDVVLTTHDREGLGANPLARMATSLYSGAAGAVMGKYVHAGIYVGDGHMVDIGPSTGVQKIPVATQAKRTGMIALRPDLPKDVVDKAVARANLYYEHRDKIHYSMPNLFRAATGLRGTAKDEADVICSSMVANMFGEHKLTDQTHTLTKPSDLARSNRLRPVARIDTPEARSLHAAVSHLRRN